MNKTKTPKDSEIEMRQLVMPGDTNALGTIFGGTIMSWIDIAGAMCAQRHAESEVVTAHISNIDFISPIKLGAQVHIMARVNYVGRTSMIIGVKVESENPYTGEVTLTTKAYLTFVAIGKDGKSVEVPRLVLETDEDKRRHENAQNLIELEKELNQKRKLKKDSGL